MYVHVSLLSTQPARAITLLAYSMELASGVSGAAYGSGAGASHTRYVETKFAGACTGGMATIKWKGLWKKRLCVCVCGGA